MIKVTELSIYHKVKDLIDCALKKSRLDQYYSGRAWLASPELSAEKLFEKIQKETHSQIYLTMKIEEVGRLVDSEAIIERLQL